MNPGRSCGRADAPPSERRDKAAALKLLKRIMKKYGLPQNIVTDRLRACSAAMKEISAADRHEVGGRLNNRAENSHQSFSTTGAGDAARFRSMKTLQKFSSVHAEVLTTNSIRSGISSHGRFTSETLRSH